MTKLAATGVALLSALAAAAPAGAAAQRGFAFGRLGGNIVPFTVSIGNDGSVKATGPVKVGRPHLTRLQIANLNRIAATNAFGALAVVTNCPGVLPDIAATFIRIGPRTVRVHGSCVQRYQRVYAALAKAVKLSY
jgi:hypothetical protein